MTREMEYAKCMAVLRKIIRMGMITENEYVAARNKLMDKNGEYAHKRAFPVFIFR